MRLVKGFLVSVLSLSLLVGCGSGETAEDVELIDKQLNQIMAAKTRYALTKTAAPVLNTHDWDTVFGGPDGSAIKYDRFGEIDELVFVALPNTFFNVQRQIRKETRSGAETIYYKVTTPDYEGTEALWVDGRFLDLRDVRPKTVREPATAAKTLISLRRLEGSPYTWHGTSDAGVPDLLRYYPPAGDVSPRTQDDWMLKGFDSLGMLYFASNGATPVDLESLGRFGEAVEIDFSNIATDELAEENDDPNAIRLLKAKAMMAQLRPLDVIHMSERTWIVLDRSEVIESRYQSKFDGKVQIASLLDTVFGLLQKGVLVKNPFEELEDANAKKVYIRRYADTTSLLTDQLTEGTEDEEVAVNEEVVVDEEANTAEETEAADEPDPATES